MAASNKRLGRGLDALFRHTNEPAKAEEITKLALRAMFPNPDQPRKHFSDEALSELTASIKEHGVLQPILVRPIPQNQESQNHIPSQPLYQIIAGERRWKASQLAGLVEVPVIIRHFNDQETLAVALIENLQREDLNPIEEAEALHHLRETYKLSQEELARQLSKSRSAIANILRLLQLPQNIREDIASGALSAGHARALLSISDDAVQHELHSRILSQLFTVRDAEEAVSHWKEKGTLPSFESTQNRPQNEDNPHFIQEAVQNTIQDTNAPTPASGKLNAQQSTSRRKAPAIKLLQKQLTEHLSVKSSISGTESKGKITLNYTNAEELQSILHALGLHTDSPK